MFSKSLRVARKGSPLTPTVEKVKTPLGSHLTGTSLESGSDTVRGEVDCCRKRKGKNANWEAQATKPKNIAYKSRRSFHSQDFHCLASYHALPFSSGVFLHPDLPPTMKALIANNIFQLEQRQVKIPEIKDNEVLIKVWAVGVNTDDIIDLKTSVDGFCPGLECSGIIEAVGRNVNSWKVGERVCALLEEGGYAEHVAVPADFLLPLPDDIDLSDAAGLPYASCCIWLALLKMHAPEALEDKSILICEGSNGIVPLAIQYAKYAGLKVIAATENIDSSKICDYYGADFCIDRTSSNFVFEVLEKAGNLASNLSKIFRCCRVNCKLVMLEVEGTQYLSVNLNLLQRKHAEIKVINLRSRDFQQKARVIAGLKTHLWPAILVKKVVPAIYHCFPASEVEKALEFLKEKKSIGKIILLMDFDKSSRHLKML